MFDFSQILCHACLLQAALTNHIFYSRVFTLVSYVGNLNPELYEYVKTSKNLTFHHVP